MSKNAYITFIIRNDSYLPGALVFAYGLRMQNTKNDLICIVSDNISEKAIENLKVLYDDVLVMPELYVPHERRQERQDRPFLFSRFQAFRIGHDGDLGRQYEKIIIADCDLLPIRDYDTLFDLEAPAGIINEKKEHCMEYVDGTYVVPDSIHADGTWNWHEIYKDIPHGYLIPEKITDRVYIDNENMGINASLMLFNPTMRLFESMIEDFNNPVIKERISRFNWPEMQYITWKLSGHWHNIDIRYSSFNGYPVIDVLKGIHYAGMKPWSIKNKSIKSYGKFEDYQLWFATYVAMIRKYPMLNNGKLKRIHDFVEDLLMQEKYQLDQQKARYFKHLL